MPYRRFHADHRSATEKNIAIKINAESTRNATTHLRTVYAIICETKISIERNFDRRKAQPVVHILVF